MASIGEAMWIFADLVDLGSAAASNMSKCISHYDLGQQDSPTNMLAYCISDGPEYSMMVCRINC